MRTTLLSTAAAAVFAASLPALPATALADNSVSGRHVVNRSIKNVDIGIDAIGSLELGPNSVSAGSIANNSVNSSELSSNSVGSTELISNSVTSADLADEVEVSSLRAGEIYVGSLFNTDYLNLGSAVVRKVADDKDATTKADFSLSREDAWAYMGFNCLDPQGCTVTMAQDFADGDVLNIYNEGETAVTFADSADVSELAGDFDMGQWDTLQLIYRDNNITNSWIELGRSDN